MKNSEEKGELMKQSRISTLFAVFAGCAILVLSQVSVSGAANVKLARVGFLHDVTGPYATYGVPMRDAMNWGLEELNKKGFTVGRDTYRLEVLVYDCASKPEVEGPGLLKNPSFPIKCPCSSWEEVPLPVWPWGQSIKVKRRRSSSWPVCLEQQKRVNIFSEYDRMQLNARPPLLFSL